MEQSAIVWTLILALGFPFFVLVFGEIIERLERRNNPLASFFRKLRHYALPSLAVFLLIRQFQPQLSQTTETEIILRPIATIFWLAVIYSTLSFINILLTPKEKKQSWQIRIPSLLFHSLRMSVILIIAGYIFDSIWDVDLGQLATALGVGSLVIALALQDTLSNLVSGFLLLFEAPFKIGDWLRVGDLEEGEVLEGEVIELNWRAVRLRTADRDIVIIPNGVLGGNIIYNYTLMDPLHAERVEITFSYQDPPNQVKQILYETAIATGGVYREPPPEVRTIAYEENAILYEVKFYVKNFDDRDDVKDAVTTRLYYAAKRYCLNFPEQVLGETISPQEIPRFLQTLPYCKSLNQTTIDTLVQSIIVKDYGIDEVIVKEGEIDDGLFIIWAGSVQLTIRDRIREEREVARLERSEFFGEMALLPREVSPVSARAIKDLTVLVIPRETAIQLISSNPQFAFEMTQYIDERRKIIQTIAGLEQDWNGRKSNIIAPIFSLESLQSFNNNGEES